MPNSKNAFTLAEIMVVMVIMAVIIAAFAINNPLAPKYKSLYYYTYKNMMKFTGEVVGGFGTGALNINSSDNAFCTSLTKNLNTVGGASACSLFTTATIALPYQGLAVNSPTFTLSNSQRFYVSSLVVGPPSYRIISVDLNGLSNPNQTDKDIVPFIVYNTGEVVPLSAPIIDKTYLSTYINSYDVNTGNFKGYVLDGSGKNIMTFKDAFCRSGAISKSAVSGTAINATTYCGADYPVALTPAVAVSATCTPGATFCSMRLSKPLINVKI